MNEPETSKYLMKLLKCNKLDKIKIAALTKRLNRFFRFGNLQKTTFKDCDQVCVGQTKKSIEIRYKEHETDFRFGRVESSAVAQHLIRIGHHIEKDTFELVKAART